MGRDKATLGDPPWAHRVARALQAGGCGSVEFQGGEAALATALWPHHPDSHPGGGPVPALLESIARHRDGAVVVAACDLPALDGGHVSALLAGTAPDGARAYSIGGRVNWSLVSIGSDLRARLAETGPESALGQALGGLLGECTEPMEPQRIEAVTDIDGISDLPGPE
ncbi:MAG: nucleotidyltransferase family protein [Microthrixaceae bacterium]|nr:nucleotidyltransferase family protein [Microthrixaceae bacterium]